MLPSEIQAAQFRGFAMASGIPLTYGRSSEDPCEQVLSRLIRARRRAVSSCFREPPRVSPRLPCGEPAAILGSGIESNRFRTIPMTAARMCGNWRPSWERNRSLTRMVRQRGLRRAGPGVVCADVSKRTAESADLVPNAPPIRPGAIPMDLILVRGSRRPCRKRNRSLMRAARQGVLRLPQSKPLPEVL